MSRAPSTLVCAAVLLLALVPAAAQTSPSAWPFPLQVQEDRGPDGLRLLAVDALLEGLTGLEQVLLTSVPLPGGGAADLDLRRVRVATLDAVLAVDGELRARPELDLTLWSGTVAGESGSEVFLALSRHGSRGWIHSNSAGLVHLTSGASSGNARMAALVSDARLRDLGVQPDLPCQANSISQPTGPQLPLPVPDPKLMAAPAFSPLYEARIALETDFQFYQLFNDLAAAQAYAEALFAATSERYRSQVGVVLTTPYLGLYTQNNDPWVSQDGGGNSIDVLYEMQNKWSGGGAPVQADLYTMLSGASLGGGVAWLDVLCNQDFGFSVSGNIHAQTPIPIIPGHPLNWDFMVFAHELGHNFATPHTHDFCPPLDECAPSGWFGACQSQQQCTTQGTIMSYCHLCPGGLENVTTFFHPTTAAVMRTAVENSCMPLFEGMFVTDLGNALSGSGGTPALAVSYDAGSNQFGMDIQAAPASEQGFIFLATSAVNASFKGGVLVPAPGLGFSVVSGASGGFSATFVNTTSFPDGIEIYSQAWFQDGPDFAATNAVLFELWVP